MSKRTRYVLITLGALIVVAFAWLWYHGWIPLASGPARAGIRHALKIPILPGSLRINHSYKESWTDYTFEAQFDIDPADFPRLLQGREYVHSSDPPHDSGYHPDRMDGGWVYTDKGLWGWPSANLKSEEMDPTCTIYTTAERDRVFLSYMAE